MSGNNSMTISYNGEVYVLDNLSEEQVDYLSNDPEQLTEYFNECLSAGANICIAESAEESAESLNPVISDNSPANTPDDIDYIQTSRGFRSHGLANVNPIKQSHAVGAVYSSEASRSDNVNSMKTNRLAMNVKSSRGVSNVNSSNVNSTNSSRASVNVKPSRGVCNLNSNQTSHPNSNQTSSNQTLLSVPGYADDTSCTASAAKKCKKSEKISANEQILYDEILVTQVMVQPMLYNPKLKSHRFSGFTAEKWKAIGERISKDCPNADTSITKVKERWTKLRDEYLKKQRLKKRVTGSGRADSDDEDDGPLDELLSGLKDVYDTKDTASNIKHPQQTFEEHRGISPKDKKMNVRKFEDGALQIIQSNSEKFLSSIENLADSFLSNKENTVNVNTSQDKISKFCDMLQLQLRELDENQFLEAQIEILQVLHKRKH